MEFRTELSVKPTSIVIDLNDSLITIGSCFADEIGQKLPTVKFNSLVNPFGTVYNPISIHNLLVMAIKQEAPRLSGYCQREGLFVHHDFHSQFADADQAALTAKLNSQIQSVHQFLKHARVLMLTYGTAWAYDQKSAKQIVANCHKIPQQRFDKILLTQKRILESFENLHKLLQEFNPALQIMLTISPVRHIKDTLELNSVSKSVLRLACHTITQSYSNMAYFPAFEIMMDDLRDYRFYKSDLIHPNEVAVQYIWAKFSDSHLTENAKVFLERWAKVEAGLRHKAFNPSGEMHQAFIQKLEDEKKKFGI